MKFRKTEKAYWTVVYHEGKRIAEFVKNEFESTDEFVINALRKMGYEMIGKLPEKLPEKLEEEPEKVIDKSSKVKPGRPRSKKD